MANHFVSDERRDDVAGAAVPSSSAIPDIAAVDAAQQTSSEPQAPHQVPTSSSIGDIPDISNSHHSANALDASSVPSISGDTPGDPSTSDASDASEALGALDATTSHADQSEAIKEAQRIATTEGFTTAFAPLTSSNEPAEPSVPRSSKPVISLRNVSKIYPAQPNKPALQDVSLDVYAGEFVFLVGHSGSGKSTLLRLLTRELKASSGQVIVAGQDLTNMRNWKVPYLRRQIGCVFQDFKLLPGKTTYENVAFALECIGKPRSVIRAQVPEVLRLVGLGEKMDSYPDQLSGGEQQRVSVARAMVNRPPLLVCDEPTGNLDPAISLGIMKLLERINRTGTTVLMATHDREMVDSMRKRVIALEGGHVVRDQERGGYGYYGSI